MAKTDFFTALPPTVSALIIADYLKLKDIIGLDTAFCGKDARNRFLSIYHEDACVLKIKQHSVVTFTIPTFLWLASRSLCVEGISLHKTWNPSFTDKFIDYAVACGRQIKFFHPALESGDTVTVEQFVSITKQCPEMAIIAGIRASFVTEHAMRAVRASNPKLMSLHVIEDDEAPEDLSALAYVVAGGLPSLKTLRIPFTEDLGMTLVKVAQNCLNLEKVEVKLGSNYDLKLPNGDNVLIALSECANFESLVLPAHTVTDVGLRALSKCSKLSVLELSDNADVALEGFEALSKGCPDLKELRLPDIQARQGAPRLSTTQFNNLQKLSLRCCTALRDADVTHLAATCPKLIDVDLYMCVNLSDASVCALSVGCPSLKKLNIVGVQFCDDTFAQLAQTSRNITHLTCAPNELFDEREGVIAAFTHLTKLEFLNVERTNLLNHPVVVSTLLEHCPQLNTLESMYAEVCEEIMELMANASFQYYGDGIFER